ncbi:MAG TPA: molybdate ABC transporter substrate-binding protein [Beijerinckiaceae bacterium]|nr:molybdate ABC transporter substrate-binding protein [Beijerinckiaceae bacterium]
MANRRWRSRGLGLVAFCLVLRASAVAAAEVTLIGPGGVRTAMMQLIPQFEKATGNQVKATFGSGGRTRQQVIDGGDFDVSIVEPPIDKLIASGQVIASSQTSLAFVPVGVAVKSGAAKPDISTPEAVKALLLRAKAISYPNGASGAGAGLSFDETLRKLGIFDEMRPKIKIAEGGAGAMALLAKGEVDIGLTYVSEIIPEPGVDVVGPLPKEISTPTPLLAFISAHAKSADAAKALVTFLSSDQAAEIYRRNGYEPASH